MEYVNLVESLLTEGEAGYDDDIVNKVLDWDKGEQYFWTDKEKNIGVKIIGISPDKKEISYHLIRDGKKGDKKVEDLHIDSVEMFSRNWVESPLKTKLDDSEKKRLDNTMTKAWKIIRGESQGNDSQEDELQKRIDNLPDDKKNKIKDALDGYKEKQETIEIDGVEYTVNGKALKKIAKFVS